MTNIKKYTLLIHKNYPVVFIATNDSTDVVNGCAEFEGIKYHFHLEMKTCEYKVKWYIFLKDYTIINIED